MKVSGVFFPFNLLCNQFRYAMQSQCTYTKVRGDRMYVNKTKTQEKRIHFLMNCS